MSTSKMPWRRPSVRTHLLPAELSARPDLLERADIRGIVDDLETLERRLERVGWVRSDEARDRLRADILRNMARQRSRLSRELED